MRLHRAYNVPWPIAQMSIVLRDMQYRCTFQHWAAQRFSDFRASRLDKITRPSGILIFLRRTLLLFKGRSQRSFASPANVHNTYETVCLIKDEKKILSDCNEKN